MKVQGWIGFAVLMVAVGCGGDDSGSTGAGGSGTGGNGGTGSAGTSGVGPGGAGGMGTGAVSGMGTGGTGGKGTGGTGGIGTGGSGGIGTGGSAGMGTGGMGTGGTGGDGTYCPEATDIVMLVHCPVCAQASTCDAPTYTDNKDGTVSSSCCGLVWQQAESDMKLGGNNMGFDESKEYCDRLKLPGMGWRVPTLAELQSLVVLNQTPVTPTIDRVAFPDTLGDLTWSSTMNRFTPKFARETEQFDVDFAFGGTLSNVPDNTLIVRCVRGGTGS